MKNKINNYDVLIVGGGLIGSLLALNLSRINKKILVIEKNKVTFQDSRTLAVNSNSKNFLEKINIWKKIKNEPQKLDKIIIKDYINKENLVFENQKEIMGHVVYSSDIAQIAYQILKKEKLILENINLDLDSINENQSINLNNKIFKFKKIILAVGKKFQNQSLNKINFNTNHKSYVGFFEHSLDHKDTAHEIFTKSGPLAALPCPYKTKFKSTFIYSTESNVNLSKLNIILKKNFAETHGKIFLEKKFSYFSLTPHLSKENKFILIGDTLRSIHPVAGQGWNLGVKDIQVFTELVQKYGLEDERFSKLYYANRTAESFGYIALTSMINSLYDQKIPLAKMIIKASFQMLRRIEPIRNLFIKQAAGQIKLI